MSGSIAARCNLSVEASFPKAPAGSKIRVEGACLAAGQHGARLGVAMKILAIGFVVAAGATKYEFPLQQSRAAYYARPRSEEPYRVVLRNWGETTPQSRFHLLLDVTRTFFEGVKLTSVTAKTHATNESIPIVQVKLVPNVLHC
jgi:hypothetical protein